MQQTFNMFSMLKLKNLHSTSFTAPRKSGNELTPNAANKIVAKPRKYTKYTDKEMINTIPGNITMPIKPRSTSWSAGRLLIN